MDLNNERSMETRQEGVSLSGAKISRMSKEEAEFWEQLMALAVLEMIEADKSGKLQPYPPSVELRTRYQEALEKHNGLRYEQVRKLPLIFNLSEKM